MPNKSPLHIVHTESSCGWGGQEIRILTEASGLMARGHKLTLVAPPKAPIYDAAKKRGINTIALPIERKKLSALQSMRRCLKSIDADVLNTHSSTDSWLTALACKTLRHAPPIVRTRHISAAVPNNQSSRWLYRSAANHIVSTGERLRRTLIKDLDIDEHRITSVPTGIDENKFLPGNKSTAREKLGLPSGEIIIGIVATLRSWKGHDDLLDAVKKLNNASVRLLIVGGGPRNEHIKDKISALGMAEKVILAGQQQQVTPWLQAMDIFVLPSYANEGVPQSILQAMLCGLPIISTPIGSIEEAIHDKQHGLIVPARDVDSLKAAIETLIVDRQYAQGLGEKARNYALEHFTLEPMLDKMEHIFHGVCS